MNSLLPTEHGLDALDPLDLHLADVVPQVLHHVQLVLLPEHHAGFVLNPNHREKHGGLADVAVYGLRIVCVGREGWRKGVGVGLGVEEGE